MLLSLALLVADLIFLLLSIIVVVVVVVVVVVRFKGYDLGIKQISSLLDLGISLSFGCEGSGRVVVVVVVAVSILIVAHTLLTHCHSVMYNYVSIK